MDMAVPRALVRSTYQEPRVNRASDVVLKVVEEQEKPAGTDLGKPPDAQQIHREIQEMPQNKISSKSPSPPAKDQSRSKPLGDIQFSQVVTENPNIKAVEERQTWFAERMRASEVVVETEIANRSPHEKSLEIRSPVSKSIAGTERHETPLVPITPIRRPGLRASSEATPQPSLPSRQISSAHSRIEASAEQAHGHGNSKDRNVTVVAKPEDKQTAFTPPSQVNMKVERIGTELQPNPEILRTKSADHEPSASITRTESLRSSSTGRLSVPSTTFVTTQRAVYQTFKDAYPEYTGDLDHFISMCRKIGEAKPHCAVWDDFVIRHLSEYTTYVSSRLMKGRDALEYAEYHNKTVTSLKFTKEVLTEELLNSLFPTPKNEKKRRLKSRDGTSNSTGRQDKSR